MEFAKSVTAAADTERFSGTCEIFLTRLPTIPAAFVPAIDKRIRIDKAQLKDEHC